MKTTDSEILKDLQEQVKALKSHINPEQDAEKLLDDLYQLQLKRQQQIVQEGIAVTLGAGEKAFKCLKSDDDAVYFQAGTAISPSMHVKHNGNLLGIVTAVNQQAGRLKCTLWTPKQSAQTYQRSETATGHNLKQSGVSMPCQLQGDTLTFYGKSFQAGTILKCQESFFEVIGSYQDGNLYVHKVKEYREPEITAPATPRRAPEANLPKNYSLYESRFVR